MFKAIKLYSAIPPSLLFIKQISWNMIYSKNLFVKCHRLHHRPHVGFDDTRRLQSFPLYRTRYRKRQSLRRLTCARMSIVLRISKRRSHNSIAPEPVCWTRDRVNSNTSATECSHQMTRWASRIYEVDSTTWLCEARQESLATHLSPGSRERNSWTWFSKYSQIYLI